jgi:hypothetical protein
VKRAEIKLRSERCLGLAAQLPYRVLTQIVNILRGHIYRCEPLYPGLVVAFPIRKSAGAKAGPGMRQAAKRRKEIAPGRPLSDKKSFL